MKLYEPEISISADNIFMATCPFCDGLGLIKGSRNWVAQGWAEAACYHCGSAGRVPMADVLCELPDGVGRRRGSCASCAGRPPMSPGRSLRDGH